MHKAPLSRAGQGRPGGSETIDGLLCTCATSCIVGTVSRVSAVGWSVFVQLLEVAYILLLSTSVETKFVLYFLNTNSVRYKP